MYFLIRLLFKTYLKESKFFMEAMDVSTKYYALTLFKMCIVGVAHFWAAKSPPTLSLKSVTHMLQWWNVAHFTLPKEDTNQVTYPLSSADISHFSKEISKFSYIKKYRYKLKAFWYIVSNSFSFIPVSKDCFIKHGYNFDNVSKNCYSGPS